MNNLKYKEKFCHHEACQALEQVCPGVQSGFCKFMRLNWIKL